MKTNLKYMNLLKSICCRIQFYYSPKSKIIELSY